MGATERSSTLASIVFLVATLAARPALAQDDSKPAEPDAPAAADAPASEAKEPPKDEKKPAKAGRIEDASTKHASFEFGSYTDTDHVTVFTPSVAGSVENVTDGASLRGSYLVDVVSAASVDIVSTASRRWTEVRQAGALDATYKPKDFGLELGGSVSSEPDYLSYGFGAQILHDFDEKNLTLLFGYGFGHDTVGRSGTSFATFARTVSRGNFTGGLTKVIDRATVLSLALDVAIENGDQSKPYRYVPVFTPDEAAKVPAGASIDYVNAHRLPERPLEQLPLARRRFALTTRLAHRFEGSTLRVQERAYADNWALYASTTDARWIFDLGRRVSVWPHMRMHVQSGVNFWQRAYTSNSETGWDLPQYRTGDRELGPLWTGTGGGGVTLHLGSASDPRRIGLSLSGDAMYTSFLDSLYVSSRLATTGILSLEGEL